MKKCVWIGLDVGKLNFSAALDLPDEGERLKLGILPQKNFRRTPEGVKSLFDWAETLAPGLEFRLVMETTGCYSPILAQWILDRTPESKVSIVNARLIHNFIKSLNLPNKTDELDARAIARFGSERTPEPFRLPSANELELKELSRERTCLIGIRVELTNRQESLRSPLARQINDQTLGNLTTQIKRLDEEIKALIVRDEEFSEEVDILTTMPGVSFISAYTILAELGSLKQYGKQELSALSGLAPRIISSGTSVYSTFLSRRSSARVRQILYLDSIVGTARIPALNDMYERLIARGKKKMQARCACMRKMLLIMRAMVINKRKFDPKFNEFPQKAFDK